MGLWLPTIHFSITHGLRRRVCRLLLRYSSTFLKTLTTTPPLGPILLQVRKSTCQPSSNTFFLALHTSFVSVFAPSVFFPAWFLLILPVISLWGSRVEMGLIERCNALSSCKRACRTHSPRSHSYPHTVAHPNSLTVHLSSIMFLFSFQLQS
jgi:hypothetical protein